MTLARGIDTASVCLPSVEEAAAVDDKYDSERQRKGFTAKARMRLRYAPLYFNVLKNRSFVLFLPSSPLPMRPLLRLSITRLI